MTPEDQKTCPSCKKWLNRPAQVNIILEYKDKVLVLHKNPKQLKNPNIRSFFIDYLFEHFPEVERKGWYDLPGGDVRPEHTLEDAIHDRLRVELGITGEIKSLVNIYDDPDRDPRTSGISFCVIVVADTNTITVNRERIDRVEWVNKEWVSVNSLYSDHQDMLGDYFKNVRLKMKKGFDMNMYSPRALGSYDPENRCAKCGQYRNRPIQVDGILDLEGAVLLINRTPEESKKDHELEQWYKYGKYCIPGGYVDRSESAREAIVREFREETGLDVKVGGVVGLYSGVDRDPKSQGISICYQVELIPGQDIDEDSFEWRDGANKDKNLAFDHAEMIRDYLK